MTIPIAPTPPYTPNVAPPGAAPRNPFHPGHQIGTPVDGIGMALDPIVHPEAHPGVIDGQIHGAPQGTGSGMVYTPGAMPLQLPPSLMPGAIPGATRAITAPPDPQALAAAGQGQTPEAQQYDQAVEAQREKPADAESRKKALKAIYGDAFPLALDREPTDSDWYRWCEDRWTLHTPGVQHNIFMAERNRTFRSGNQYQSRINASGAWRETPIPRDSVRIVDNRIRPALAWQMQVVAEQRPGWRFKPTNTDPDRERKAEAQQRAVEYQYDAQHKRLIDKESVYWAQTDGCSFQMTYWNPDLGPWEELEAGKGPVPLGEPDTRVFRIEQVRVSSEATGSIAPMYWLVRDILPMQYAVSLYGPDVADSPDQALLAQQTSQYSTTNQYAYAPLFQNQMTVARYFVFCEKRDWMPQGLTAIVVGRKLVYGPQALLMGRVPMTRITDGSEDPAFFPVPKMNLLIAPQMRVNMLWSKWYESIRKNSGGRYATKTNAVSAETFIGGETSLLEVRTSGDIRESFMPVQGFSVGNDIKEALDREIATIEELTGYTKQARGQFENDESGRAILAQRETLERVFSPLVAALAEGNTEWAKQQVGWMRFGYQMPRKIAITGKNRSDLASELTAADLDGIIDVTVDPETLVPQPRALRQWMLDQAYDRKLITGDVWRERSPFGDVREMEAPGRKAQYQKAKRVAEQIRLGQPQEPVVWQDDEALQQSVLEDELILAGGIDPMVMQAAQMRWQALAMQAVQKLPPPMLAAGAPPPKQLGSGKPAPMDPRTQPLGGSNPSIAAPPNAAVQGGPGVSHQEQAAARFEQAAA